MGIKLPHLNAEGMVKLSQLQENARDELNLRLVTSTAPAAIMWASMPRPAK
jgi:hypothetical protein